MITKTIRFAAGLVLGIVIGAVMASKRAVSHGESNDYLNRSAVQAAVTRSGAALKAARKSVDLGGGEGIAETGS